MPRPKPLDPPKPEAFRLLTSEWDSWKKEAKRQKIPFRAFVQMHLRQQAETFEDKRRNAK